MIRRAAGALLVFGLLETGAMGQTPLPTSVPSSNPAPAATSGSGVGQSLATAVERGYRDPLPTDPADPNYHAGAHRSIMRHNPLPQRTSYQSHYRPSSGGAVNSSGGTGRSASPNPNGSGSGYSDAGVGRMAEYYDNHTLDPPINYHAVPVARFDNGGGPDRAEQIAARNAGTQRSNTIQSTINTFGTPYAAFGAGFGYGLGLGGGRLYSFPN